MSNELLESKMRSYAPIFKKSAWPILILSSLLTIGLVADLTVMNTPSFHTDLADFAPDSESSDAHDRISEHFGNETRPMFVHVTRDDGGNVLDIESL